MKNVKPIYIVEDNDNNRPKNIKIPKINIPNNINNANESKYNNYQKYNNNHNYKNKIIIQNKKEESNEEETNIKKNEILQNVNKIFLNNSQYNTKEKDYFMNRFQIIEILKKAKIIAKGIISKTQADLILTKINPHKRKYNLIDFVNFLTEICHYIYKEDFELSPKETLDYFLCCLFNNLSDYIEEKNSKNFLEKIDDNTCTIKCIETIIISKLEKPLCKLLLTLYDSFKKIYKVYFQNELTSNVMVNKEILLLSSSENLLQFAINFEIVPYIINKTNLNTYYNILIKYQVENPEIINIIMHNGDKRYKDIGIIFKLSSFFLFIYHFSFFFYYKDFKVQNIEDINNFNINNDEYDNTNNVDKIILFLQKLENSNGIQKYIKKRGRTNEDKFTFIPNINNIKMANKEMKKEKNSIMLNESEEKVDKLKSGKKKYDIESSPYTSGEVTERKVENNIYYIKTDKSFSQNNQNIVKNNNLNEYYKEKVKNEDNYLSISELKKILNVSPSIQNEIINNIESLSEIFLKYSKIYNKLEYNRMSVSSFIQFLKDANILYFIPDEQKNNYRKLSNTLLRKNNNFSEILKNNNTIKFNLTCNNIITNEEKKYKKNISQIVNTNNFQDKISISEASLIFFSLTNSNNFPSNKNKIRTQFDKNTGNKSINMNSYIEKTFCFDTKRENYIQKNIPNKMNFILFIKSFEPISEKLYPEMSLDDAVSNLLNKKIIPFIQEKKINIIDSEEMKEALAKLNNVNIQKFLIDLAKVIHPLYTIYSDLNGNMKFYQFFDFYKNFGIFPELISLTQLKTIFFSLCESYSSNSEGDSKNIQKKNEQIDISLFLESLGISSMFFNFKDIISDIDRLLYLCYFIWKSDGIQNQKIEENIPQKINRSFIELFKKYNKEENYNYNNNEEFFGERKNNENKKSKYNFKKSASNPNFNENKLILTYNKDNKEYNCTTAQRGIYRFEDIYK